MLVPMDLRDRFASHFAAALVDAFSDPERVAAQAYDLAEAMLRERARRIDAEEGAAIAFEPHQVSFPLSYPPAYLVDDGGMMVTLEAPPMYAEEAYAHAALLDDPEPMDPESESMEYDDELEHDDDAIPDWLEASDDPRWELEERFPMVAEAQPRRVSSRPPGPGLARTEPAADEPAAERPARTGRSA
jgi:hypothetical protein